MCTNISHNAADDDGFFHLRTPAPGESARRRSTWNQRMPGGVQMRRDEDHVRGTELHDASDRHRCKHAGTLHEGQ